MNLKKVETLESNQGMCGRQEDPVSIRHGGADLHRDQRRRKLDHAGERLAVVELLKAPCDILVKPTAM